MRDGTTHLVTGGGAASFATITGAPADNAALAAALAAKLSLTGGTMTGALAITAGALNTAALSGSQTWNNAGVTCRGIEYAVTDTNSAADSTLMRLLGGAAGITELLKLTKTGALSFGSSSTDSGAVMTMTASTGSILFGITGSVDLLLQTGLVLGANKSLRFGFTGATDPILTASASTLTLTQANLVLGDGLNFGVGTTTGSKIGTSATQKIGFWDATPVVQQVLATGAGATVDNVITFLQTIGLCKQS